MYYLNRRSLLARRPSGMPTNECWKRDEVVITSIQHNQILIKVEYLSIDPYMRGRMNEGVSYASPAKIDQPMTGETAGIVVESKSNLYKVGDKVCIHQGWQTYIVANDTDPSLTKIPSSSIPLSVYLGTLGMPGRTAYFGLNRVGKPKSGETLVVSAASGAVGSVVGQLAKKYGCKVIGIAGGEEKCAYVKNVLNFDECIDYKNSNLNESLKILCPNGIDIYFENVGGKITEAVLTRMNIKSRIALCGLISGYNAESLVSGPAWGHLLIKRIKLQGFIIFDYQKRAMEAFKDLGKWINEGKIKYRNDVVPGIENASSAIKKLFSGENNGKLIVQISDE